ncbi:thioredoxin domain-containing protein [Streptomyces sp. NPDC051907]|uniref:DsbA family protein n=1 Tax=Streptomyces sp. NPDC051907 TaxID=3155284 RepID=UPI003421C359
MQAKSVRRPCAVAALATVGVMLAGCGPQAPAAATPATPAPYAGVAELPEALDPDGTTIVVGDPRAETKVRVYEDPRCPVVEEYERTGAGAAQEMALARKVRKEYVFASFRDESLGGDGSKRAVNALRAALDAGKFAEYHAVLFENQEEVELNGGFTTASLLRLADKVSGLRSKTFDSAVTTMKYRSFVTASQDAYQAVDGSVGDGPGTPSVTINHKEVPEDIGGVIMEREVFKILLNDVHIRPWAWRANP